MTWNGPGVLTIKDKKGKSHDIKPGAEIDNDMLSVLSEDRVKQLKAKGMISGGKKPGRPATARSE